MTPLGVKRPDTEFVIFITCDLADAEDHKFSGADGCDADFDIQPAQEHGLRSVDIRIALDVVSLSGAVTGQSSFAPQGVEEIADGAFDQLPEVFVVGFKHHPLGSLFDGLLDIAHQTADVDVAPFDIVGFGEGASPPDADAPVGKVADACP